MKRHVLKKMGAIACAVTVMVSALSGCGGSGSPASATVAPAPKEETVAATTAETEAEEEELSLSTRVVMSTGSSGSLYYTGGIAVTQLWMEKIPGASASASSSSGSVENAKLLIDGETNMGIIQSNVIADAYNGAGDYEGNPQEQLRVLTPLCSATYHIVARKDAGINCLADSKGKRVCVFPAGSGNATTLNCLYSAIGMSFDDVKGSNVALSESIDALKNGSLDMTIVFGQYPNSTVMDALAGSSDLMIVPFSEDEIKKITEANAWITPETVPAGTYDGQTEDFATLTHSGFICVTEEFPEEDAYALVKTMFTNLDDLYTSYAALNCQATQNPIGIVNPLGVPLHPGAERAFKELGYMQ